MSWMMIIAAVIVLISAVAVFRFLRLLVLYFSIAFCGLMLVHFQNNPAEATVALGTLGGGLLGVRPLRGLISRVIL